MGTRCDVPHRNHYVLHPGSQWLSNEHQPEISDITGIAFDRTLSPQCFPSTGNEWLLEGRNVTGNIRHLSEPIPVMSSIPAAPLSPNPTLTLDAWIYCCLSEGEACMMKAVSFRQPLLIGSVPQEGSVMVTLEHAF